MLNKLEREQLLAIIDDVQDSDDKIDQLERLFLVIKRMVNGKI